MPQASIPLLPPEPRTSPWGDVKDVGTQPNKRTLNCDMDSHQAGGSEPKRARLEVGVEEPSALSLDGKFTTVSSTEEEVAKLPVGLWEQARRKQASRIQNKMVRWPK